MGRDSNSKKKPSNEEEKFRFTRRSSTASKGESSSGHNERPREKEVLPPAPPLTSNVKPRRYVDVSPTPSPSPPRSNRSDRPDLPAGVALALPATAQNKTGADIAQVVKPSSEDTPSASHNGGSEDAEEITLSDLDKIPPVREASATPPAILGNTKKRSESPNEVQQQQSPQPSDLNDEMINKFLSPRAKRVKGMVEDCLQTLKYEGPELPLALLPASTVQGPRRLDLPEANLAARLQAGCVRMGLEEVQKFLQQKPLNKAGLLEAMEASTSAWTTQYGGSVPDVVKYLISLFETLGMRLEGKTPPSLFGEDTATLANKEARPLLEKLKVAVTSITEEVRLLDEEVPSLDKDLLAMKTLEDEQEQRAEELERQAAEARKKAKEFRNQQRTAAARRECLKIAIRTFRTQTKQLKSRATKVTEFLKFFDEEEKRSKAEEPPEAALILSYVCDPPEST